MCFQGFSRVEKSQQSTAACNAKQDVDTQVRGKGGLSTYRSSYCMTWYMNIGIHMPIYTMGYMNRKRNWRRIFSRARTISETARSWPRESTSSRDANDMPSSEFPREWWREENTPKVDFFVLEVAFLGSEWRGARVSRQDGREERDVTMDWADPEARDGNDGEDTWFGRELGVDGLDEGSDPETQGSDEVICAWDAVGLAMMLVHLERSATIFGCGKPWL